VNDAVNVNMFFAITTLSCRPSGTGSLLVLESRQPALKRRPIFKAPLRGALREGASASPPSFSRALVKVVTHGFPRRRATDDFLRCSLPTYRFRYARRYRQSGSDRLEISEPTDGVMAPTL
jgi:hypothetical protein